MAFLRHGDRAGKSKRCREARVIEKDQRPSTGEHSFVVLGEWGIGKSEKAERQPPSEVFDVGRHGETPHAPNGNNYVRELFWYHRISLLFPFLASNEERYNRK